MKLEQMKGSIKGYFYDRWNVTVIDEIIPVEIPIPSMYFPSPSIIPNPRSKFAYENTYSMTVKLFSTSSSEALDKAELIAQSIRSQKNVIPVLNADGTKADSSIVFESVQSEVIEEGTAQVRLQWTVNFDYVV